jgi:hypothetical protein
MEDILPFFKDNTYVKNKRIKSIKLYIKMLDEPSLQNEVYAFRYDFNLEGYPSLKLAFDRDGNIGQQTEYNSKGEIIKIIENHFHIATMQRPEIDTIIFKYQNGRLIEEEEINEDYSFGTYKKEVKYRIHYKYDSQNRLIEKVKNYLYDNSKRKKTFEYPSSNIIQEFDYMENGELNTVTYYTHNASGKLIEEKCINSYQYKEPDNPYQMYKHVYIYSNDLMLATKSYDNKNNLKTKVNYEYDSKNNLYKIEQFEEEKLSITFRIEHKYYSLLNTLFS